MRQLIIPASQSSEDMSLQVNVEHRLRDKTVLCRVGQGTEETCKEEKVLISSSYITQNMVMMLNLRTVSTKQ